MTSAEREAIEEQEREKENKRIKAAFRRCFKSTAGEVVLKHLDGILNRTTSFVPGDPHKTAFNEGRRTLYLEMLDMMEES